MSGARDSPILLLLALVAVLGLGCASEDARPLARPAEPAQSARLSIFEERAEGDLRATVDVVGTTEIVDTCLGPLQARLEGETVVLRRQTGRRDVVARLAPGAAERLRTVSGCAVVVRRLGD